MAYFLEVNFFWIFMTVWGRLKYFVLLLFIISFSSDAFALDDSIGWTHIELGAGNYGTDGHTKTSQAMTVLMKLKNVSEKKNYVDELEEVGRGDYNPEEQYAVLFWTLDELIKRYGDIGVFHVNDLYEQYAVFAAQKLKEYAESKGYDSVIIEAIPGDFASIDPKQTLSQYGKNKYYSVHLKNPESSLYHDQMDGNHFYSSDQAREQTRQLLGHLANLSDNGLFLFILYNDYFVPIEERTEFVEKNIFYHASSEWDSVPYIFPEGRVVDKEVGRVFHIEPTTQVQS